MCDRLWALVPDCVVHIRQVHKHAAACLPRDELCPWFDAGCCPARACAPPWRLWFDCRVAQVTPSLRRGPPVAYMGWAGNPCRPLDRDACARGVCVTRGMAEAHEPLETTCCSLTARHTATPVQRKKQQCTCQWCRITLHARAGVWRHHACIDKNPRAHSRMRSLKGGAAEAVQGPACEGRAWIDGPREG
jgi:hypothetical protein